MTTRTIRRRTGRRHAPRSVRTAATVVLLVLIVVAFAQLIAPEPRDALSLATRLAAPSATHWLGTDELGRDVLSRTIYSTQTSVLIAACATILSGLIGAVMGTLAGWFGGTIDTMVSFVIDIQSSIPAFILALGAVVFFGGSPIALVLVLALEGWERIARILRAEVMAARRSGYINAALNLGVPTGTVIRHHLLRALFAPLGVLLTLAFPAKILIESALSFLGLGIRPPQTSLGQMVGIGREYLATAWWIAVVPGVVIFAMSVAISILGDHLQERVIGNAG